MLFNLLRPLFTNAGNKLQCYWQAFLAKSNVCVQGAKAGAYPRMEHLKVVLMCILRPFSQTLDCAQTLARNKYSNLSPALVKYDHKKLYNIVSRAQCYQTFYVRNLQMLEISCNVIGRPFQPSLMFVSKVPRQEPSLEWSTWKMF